MPSEHKPTSMLDRDGFKLEIPHRKECWVKDDPIQFIVHEGSVWDRDKLGRKNGSTQWHKFACNDPHCEALLLVRWDVLASFINGAPYEPRSL